MINQHRLTKYLLAVTLFCLLVPNNGIGGEFAFAADNSTAVTGKKPKTISKKYIVREDIVLVGTICSGNKKLNLAVIEDTKNKVQSVFRTGSKLSNGAIIKEIFPDHILVEKNKKTKAIKITGGSAMQSSHDLQTKGYQKISPSQWIVDPNKLFKSFLDVAKLCGDLKIAKFVDGFLIKSIGNNEFLKALGLKAGDIITKANNNKFENLYAALEYLWDMEDDSSLEFEISPRNGDKKNLEIYPVYDQLPGYFTSSTFNPQRTYSMLKAKHSYVMSNIVYK